MHVRSARRALTRLLLPSALLAVVSVGACSDDEAAAPHGPALVPGLLEEGHVFGIAARPAALDVIHAEAVQLVRNLASVFFAALPRRVFSTFSSLCSLRSLWLFSLCRH